MNALAICVLVAAVSVVFGHPMPQWHSANGGGGGGSRYGGNSNRGGGGYGSSSSNNNNNNYPQQQQQQQYPSSSGSGYQQQGQQQGYQNQQQQQSSYGSRPQQQQQQSYGGGYSSSSSSYSAPQAQLYQGRFTGTCQADGFYYNDQQSLVFCTNGISYVQMCASGSQNMDVSRYTAGVDTYVSFCNVNLVDNGAGASGSSYGSSSSGNSYGSSSGSSSSYGNTQRQTYAPIYPQQPTYVTMPMSQSYGGSGYQSQQSSSYQQQSSGSY